MASGLDKFIAEVKNAGLTTLNRYSVKFSLPNGLVDKFDDSSLQIVQMYCHGMSLPGITLTTQQQKTYGEYREFPYEKLFNNINMNFYIDSSMNTKGLFDMWMGSIQNPITREFSYYEDYITDIEVTVQDKADKDLYSVTFHECYPKSVGDIHLEYSSKDIMSLPVSMNYKWWTSSKLTPLPPITVSDPTKVSYMAENGKFQTIGEA